MNWVQINIQVNEEGLNFFQVLFTTTRKALREDPSNWSKGSHNYSS